MSRSSTTSRRTYGRPLMASLTSSMATQALIEGGVSRRARKGVVDKVAATLILQSYLDYRKAADPEAREPSA